MKFGKGAWLVALAVSAALSAPAARALDEFRLVAEGATEEVADALGAASVVNEAFRNKVTDPTELLAAARADYARMVGALYGEGYYGGVVNILVDGREAAAIDPLRTPSQIDSIVIQVQPGPLYRFSQADIAPVFDTSTLPEGYAVGQPAKSGVIQEAVDASVNTWREIGYAKATVGGQRIVADHPSNALDASVTIDTGPRLRFGEMRLDADSRVSERRLRKIAGFPTGEQFDPNKLDRTAKRLRDTGVFSSVALIEADTANPDGTLDVTARIVDREPRRFGFGAEYLADEGVTLSAFWLHRNLLGGAERFRVGAEISGIAGDTGGEDFSFDLELTRPATPSADTDAFLTFELASVNEPDYSADSVKLGFGFLRRFDEDITGRIALEYSLSDETDDTGNTTFRHLALPIGVTIDRRNSLLNATDGWYVDAEIAPYFGLSGSESGTRSTLDLRGYQQFGGDDKFVVAARVQAGAIYGASITGLPNDLRFYSGGGGTVRGQPYQSLEIDLGGGVSSGGRSFLGLQSEVRYRVTDNIWAVGFADWGHISADSTPGSGGESHAGAGLGVRYDTGIGPIRLDVGVPVGGDTDGGVQVYIGVGQAF
ncbi:MAG: autotransporter assembly complex family protein [Pseudomonadota bacterium]